MKTLVRNLIASLFLGTALFSANAETITTGAVVNTNNQEVVSYTVHHISCAGLTDGSIDIEVANNTVSSFSWDNGSTTEDLTNLSSGNYRVKIKTTEGEILFASFEITAPEPLQGMITQTDLHTAVNLDLFVQGGVAPYTYDWSNGETSEDLFGITTEGAYNVTITDENGCQVNVASYVATQAASIAEAVESTFNLYPNPNNGNGTITWNNADVNQITIVNAAGQIVDNQEIANQTSATFNGLTPGMYVAKVQTNNTTQNIQFVVQ
jgi:hypothetical protein